MTVLAFSPAFPDADPAPENELQTLVERWSDDLLPELITTRGKGQHKLLERVRAKLMQLPRNGVGTFAFKHVVKPLKHEMRLCWAAIFERADGVETAAVQTAGERAIVVALVPPDTTFDTRNSFRRLVDCVVRNLTSFDDERARDEIGAIWEILLSWASEAGDRSPSRPRTRPAGVAEVESSTAVRDR